MNIQFYVGRISDAAASIMMEAGFGRDAFVKHRLGSVAVNQNIDYVSELHAGDLVRMETGMLQAEGRKIRFHHRLFNAETGALCMKADVDRKSTRLNSRQ